VSAVERARSGHRGRSFSDGRGPLSTGVQNDLQRATDIARPMVTEYGMSDALGAISYEGGRRPTYLNVPVPQEWRPSPRRRRAGSAPTSRARRTLLLGGLVALAIAVPVRLAYGETCGCSGRACYYCTIEFGGCDSCEARCETCDVVGFNCQWVRWECLEG
jgi:hypothetical protein